MGRHTLDLPSMSRLIGFFRILVTIALACGFIADSQADDGSEDGDRLDDGSEDGDEDRPDDGSEEADDTDRR